MYICKNCYEAFEEPKLYYENFTPGGSHEDSFVHKYDGCPFCSGGYEEIVICDICEENIIDNNYEVIKKNNNLINCCDKCLKEIEEKENEKN